MPGSSYGPLLLKLDIDAHNHLEIEQERIVFSFGLGTELTLQVNFPEQIFALVRKKWTQAERLLVTPLICSAQWPAVSASSTSPCIGQG